MRKVLRTRLRLQRFVVALLLHQSIQVLAQPASGLFFSPTVEAGYFAYLSQPNKTARGLGIPVGVGCGFGIRFHKLYSIDLTSLAGFRSFEERFSILGIEYELSHRYVDFVIRLQFAQTLHSKDQRFWELGYGTILCSSNGGISLSTSDGHSGYHSGSDPSGFGLTSSLVHGWGSFRPIRFGLATSFIVVVPKEFRVPWENQTDPRHPQRITIGQPRFFIGLTCSVGLLRLFEGK
jgi:hypothetical protein